MHILIYQMCFLFIYNKIFRKTCCIALNISMDIFMYYFSQFSRLAALFFLYVIVVHYTFVFISIIIFLPFGNAKKKRHTEAEVIERRGESTRASREASYNFLCKLEFSSSFPDGRDFRVRRSKLFYCTRKSFSLA